MSRPVTPSRHIDSAIEIIDRALADHSTSADAMRWTPEPVKGQTSRLGDLPVGPVSVVIDRIDLINVVDDRVYYRIRLGFDCALLGPQSGSSPEPSHQVQGSSTGSMSTATPTPPQRSQGSTSGAAT